jgi:DNA helicase-2/ATP-dependent DNA helicase PcrA
MIRKLIKNLNKEQIEIINNTKNSIYVLAGAGTGKTKTLTTKIAYLLEKLKINPKNILAITFTNNAMQEMRKRLQEMLNKDFPELNIETFHSLGNKILKKFANQLNFNFNSYFNIIDEKESKIIIKEQIQKLYLGKNFFSISQIKNYISLYKNQLIKRKIFSKLKYIYKEQNNNLNFDNKELEKIYLNYNIFLKKNNLMDFDDLIIYSYDLLSNNSLISNFYQKQFNYVLVDEFQDIDIIQYQIIKILSKKSIVLVVGDPNQNIYNFRGSDIICSDFFLKDFNASIYRLFRNYRSTKNILSISNLLIKQNYKEKKNNFENPLKSIKGKGKQIIYKHFLNSYMESDFIIENIKKLIKNKKANYGEIAILYRLNDLNRDIETNLLKHNIPYKIEGFISFYQKKEIKDFLSYLKVIISPKKDFYLKRIINVPSRKIGKKTLEKLEKIAYDKNISLFEALNYLENKKIKSFQKLLNKILENFQNNEICNLSNFIMIIDKIIGYSSSIERKNLEKNQGKNFNKIKELKKNLIRLQNIFANYKFPNNKENLLNKIFFLLEQISFSNENQKIEQKNKVVLSSIHKAKGLEFKIVFFIGLEEKNFINNQKNYLINNNLSIEEQKKEERRLVYVAITRSQEYLFLTSAQNRFLFGNLVSSKPVSFIKEMKIEQNNYELTKINNINSIQQKYQIADKVIHNNFGIGRIISMKEDIVTISFEPPYSIKKILITHNSLKKINK